MSEDKLDYVEMAEQDDAAYEAKKDQASVSEEEMSVEAYLDSSIGGCQDAIRLLARKLGEVAARPDPRTYLDKLASPAVKPAEEPLVSSEAAKKRQPKAS